MLSSQNHTLLPIYAHTVLATVMQTFHYERKCDISKIASRLIFNFTLFYIKQQNESFHKFEARPINCVLATTIVFNKNPLYKCQFLQLYLFDCCRACNAVYAKCMTKVGALNGGPEYCYRESYKCMCKCMDKHTPPEIPPFPSP